MTQITKTEFDALAAKYEARDERDGEYGYVTLVTERGVEVAFASYKDGECLSYTLARPRVATAAGIIVDYDMAVMLMDDGLREELHGRMAGCTEQEFFDAYAAAHAERFGETFRVAD